MNIITPVFAVTLTITSLVAANQATKPIDMPIHDTGTIKFETTEKLKPIETSKLEPKQIKPPKAVASPPASSSVKAEQVSKFSSATPTNGSIEQIIVKWAKHYGNDQNHMLRIAKCESTYGLNLVNRNYTAGDGSNPTGVYQFIRSTWLQFGKESGISNSDQRMNADVNIQLANWAFANNKGSHWECR
jgi:soluble lytic murein transglycosylase-like protein